MRRANNNDLNVRRFEELMSTSPFLTSRLNSFDFHPDLDLEDYTFSDEIRQMMFRFRNISYKLLLSVLRE